MPMVLIASNKVPAQNMAELLALAKQDPGKLSYGSPGIGTAHHLNFESLLRKTGTQMMHVPYKGSSLMMTDIVSGNVYVGFSASRTEEHTSELQSLMRISYSGFRLTHKQKKNRHNIIIYCKYRLNKEV